jgi:hypothetical protein
LVDREHRRRRTELGAHVSDGGTVREGHLTDARSVELDKLSDHTVATQHVGNREHDIGGGDAGRDVARQSETDHPRDQHRDGLTQHGRFRFDSTDTPTEDAETVDHRRVGVGSDTGVGESEGVSVDVAGVDNLGQVFNVHLVNDSRPGRNHLEVLEGHLTPAQKLVTLAVSLVFDFDVSLQGILATEEIRNHRVVDDEFRGGKRIDFFRVSAEFSHCLAHRGQVDDARHTREVLHDHPCWSELDFRVGFRGGVPITERANLFSGDVFAVFCPQQVFEQDLEAEGQTLVARYGIQSKNRVVTSSNGQGGLRTERIDAHD